LFMDSCALSEVSSSSIKSEIVFLIVLGLQR
jgi:hypothetical protein